MRTDRWLTALLGAALLLPGCTGDVVEEDAPFTAPPSPASAAALEAPGLRTLDLGPAKARAIVRVEVREGEGSFLFSTQADDLDEELGISDVTGPDGESVVPDASLLDSPAEVSVLVTGPQGEPLAPGAYDVHLDTDVRTEARVTFKAVAAGRQVLDVRVWDVTKKAKASGEAAAQVEQVLRIRGEEAFEPVDLRVGSLSFVRAPSRVVTAHATLRLPSSGTERQLRELCRVMRATLGPALAVDVVLVDSIVDRTDEDFDLFGSAAAIPGATFTPDAATACVAVAVSGAGGPRAQASTVWHEAGHLLGLFHTSEDDGAEWDPIDDTPQCTERQDDDDDGYVSEDECRSLDGGNLMFSDTQGAALTLGQAAVLRAHPLLHAPVQP